ncbi:MAG TPA: endo alpha-1,4 polygalactosaminidase [Balneolales bacterium]|nr:endo alpha-1,4 polygalactosaminidase [Balneolales bacterium]
MFTSQTFKTRIIFIPALMVILFSGLVSCNYSNNLTSFFVDYGDLNSNGLIGYNLGIVEPDNYNRAQVSNLRRKGVKVIAYVSLGEVNPSRWYYSELKKRGFLGVNGNWNSYYINLQDSVSRSILLNEVIPKIMQKGFDGLFLDTVDDVAPNTKRSNLQPYMVELIKAIRDKYRNKYIIQNSGFFLLDKTKNEINAILIEDVATNYNFNSHTYRLATQKYFNDRVNLIRKYQKIMQKPFYIVDYADNKTLQQEVEKRLNGLGIPYFIGTINLNSEYGIKQKLFN